MLRLSLISRLTIWCFTLSVITQQGLESSDGRSSNTKTSADKPNVLLIAVSLFGFCKRADSDDILRAQIPMIIQLSTAVDKRGWLEIDFRIPFFSELLNHLGEIVAPCIAIPDEKGIECLLLDLPITLIVRNSSKNNE